jgi:hypothetical protein
MLIDVLMTIIIIGDIDDEPVWPTWATGAHPKIRSVSPLLILHFVHLEFDNE